MESLKELYRIGVGPSSSHTMGPRRAAERFLARQEGAPRYRVTLFGSLAATGKGHLTDATLREVFAGRELEVVWKPGECLPRHPNALRFEALDAGGEVLASWQVYSVGGGAIREEGEEDLARQVYDLHTMGAILDLCERNGQSLWEYVEACEGGDIWPYLAHVWQCMRAGVQRGLRTEGVLPGGLGVARKAWAFHRRAEMGGEHFRRTGLLAAYALATSEENAAGGEIVTAPTCGSCGVAPAVLYYLQEQVLHCTDEAVWRALATAGLIGNLVKTNASISGAEVGCQGEIGTACAMAAGAAVQLLAGTARQIESAAETALEHHLGLTCDPVGGLVQIPCIERNAFAAARALTCADYSLFTDGVHRISFDEVTLVMRQTGRDLPSLYRETASGGLARAYRQRRHLLAKRG